MNPNQQFCLRWNNHQSTLISVFEALLESGTLVDCTLAAEGQYLKAHKVVLSACSPYLGMLLSQDFEKHPILILKDVKFAQLKSMLDYMYRGEVNISQDQLGTFLKAAESLQIKGLTDSGNSNSNRENGSGGNNGSDAEDYNARHRKHLALMAAAAARARSPSMMEHQQNLQNQHQRWMGNGGSMHHEMMRDGSVSPSPTRKRKRPRRPSLGHNPMHNGHHEDMPLQPLIQQAQANSNNVLAQSLAAPPLGHMPKSCVTPPRANTPQADHSRDEEAQNEVSLPSPKPVALKSEPVERNNNNASPVPFKAHLEKMQSAATPTGAHADLKQESVNNNNGEVNNHASEDEAGCSDSEERVERRKEDMMMDEDVREREEGEMCDEDIEEDLMDEENSRSAASQGATMANAHWLMADASLPNSDSFQDSKVEVPGENQKIKLVQQDKLIAPTPTPLLVPPHLLGTAPTLLTTPTSSVATTSATNTAAFQMLSTSLAGQQLKTILTSPTSTTGAQLKLQLNPMQLQSLQAAAGAGQTRQIYLTNFSRLITFNPGKAGQGTPVRQNLPAALLLDTTAASKTAPATSHAGNSNSSTALAPQETLSCNMCGKKYQWKQSLTRHIREHRCAKGPQHSCPCCNLSFKHTSSLNKHVMLCSAVHSRLQQAQGGMLAGLDDDVQEIRADEDMTQGPNDNSTDSINENTTNVKHEHISNSKSENVTGTNENGNSIDENDNASDLNDDNLNIDDDIEEEEGESCDNNDAVGSGESCDNNDAIGDSEHESEEDDDDPLS
uniref:Longitudinals lacking protein, isoforms F/I/K/T n=1 Tax=Cacopsylla melanoneura TaxID=428564 RepID=A0A8D8V9T2_9HEMI